MGGLGNQLFQYAFAKEIEHKTGQRVQLETSFYDGETNQRGKIIPTRFFLLDKFDLEYETVPPDDTHRCNGVVRDMDYDFQKRYDDTYFIGYWQAEKYFFDIRQEINKMIRLKDDFIDEEMQEMGNQIKECDSVSIHVRRADYLKLGIYPICGKSYYIRALEKIKEEISNPVLFVYSDDLTWCRENLNGLCGCETHFVTVGVDYKEWYLMNKSKHNIIANSSFSFWSAYVNSNPGKIVCAPKLWVHSEIIAPTDVKEWVYL